MSILFMGEMNETEMCNNFFLYGTTHSPIVKLPQTTL